MKSVWNWVKRNEFEVFLGLAAIVTVGGYAGTLLELWGTTVARYCYWIGAALCIVSLYDLARGGIEILKQEEKARISAREARPKG